MITGNDTQLNIQELAALIMGVTYIPPGMTLMELLEAFREDAEVNLHNQELEQPYNAEKVRQLTAIHKIAKARCAYAKKLLDSLPATIEHALPSETPLNLSEFSEETFCLSEVSDWTDYNLAIVLYEQPQPAEKTKEAEKSDTDLHQEDRNNLKVGSDKDTNIYKESTLETKQTSEPLSWPDITIELRPDNCIAVKHKDTLLYRLPIARTKFGHKTTGKPNKQYENLLKLVGVPGKKGEDNFDYIEGCIPKPPGKDKVGAQVTRLGQALKDLVPNAQKEPGPTRLDTTGSHKHVARFKIIDGRDDHIKRAEKKYRHRHIAFDDNQHQPDTFDGPKDND